jgi:gag-polypeptide of LTR copia-type
MPFHYKGEPLIGKSNYIEWKIKADLYLKINSYMSYITGLKKEPEKSLYFTKEGEGKNVKEVLYSHETAIKYFKRLTEYEDNQNKALEALKSILSNDNVERFKAIKSANSLYQEIQSIFSETSFEQIGIYFDKISETSYNEAKSINSYTSTIQSSYYSLKKLKNVLSKTNIAWQLLKGLPSSFDPFISRKYIEISENITDNKKIDINKLIAELISKESRINSFSKEDKAYIGKLKSKRGSKHY